MEQRSIWSRILLLLTCTLPACIGVPLQINFQDWNTEETVQDVAKSEPPDVFSIISAANKGSKTLLHEGDIAIDIARNAIKCDSGACRWKKNSSGIVNVPYNISSKISKDVVSTILTSMQEYATLSCVRFVPRTTESDYLQIGRNDGCWSFIGKFGGAQTLSLDIECTTQGTVQHELNHALGFYHEQGRSDRDDYVDIIVDNIYPGFIWEFMKYDANNLGLQYDYSSVMHYGRFAFSVSSSLPTIVPKPDSNVPIGQRYGLSTLDVAKINKLYECGLCRELLTDFNGTVTSSNYPDTYPSGSDCVWLIRLPYNKIFLEFSAFDVQASPNCASDYLRIYDGPSRSSPLLLYRACGVGQMPPMVSSGNTMLIEFISDNKMEATGFNASYSSVTCGSVFTSPIGTVSSPGYPSSYPPSMNCVWVIIAPAGRVVSLNVTDFYVEFAKPCLFDHLRVYDGPKVTSPLIGKYCGKETVIPSIKSTGNSLLLQFTSDTSIQLKGFLAKYAFVPQISKSAPQET